MKVLIAIPIYNEENYLVPVLNEVRRHGYDLLIVNDGSTDGTARLLAAQHDIYQITHPKNRGYGAALISAMGFAQIHQYDALVTMDCDGQHEPDRIPLLLEALCGDVDIVSGSRYLRDFKENTAPPDDRRRINHAITAELNDRFALGITDAFCGFKAYSVNALRRLNITDQGYAMPMQLWVQAAHLGLHIREVAVPLVYLDLNRAFGGALDDGEERMRYYRRVMNEEESRVDEMEDELESSKVMSTISSQTSSQGCL